MNETKGIQTTNLTSRIRSSLVIKLNMQMAGKLLLGFLSVNILIIMMGFFAILWKAEESAKPLVETSVVDKPHKGIVFPEDIQRWLPLKEMDAKRSIDVANVEKGSRLLEKIDGLEYVVSFSKNGVTYGFVYKLGSDLKLFLFLFLILLAFELLMIIESLIKGSRMIKKTLKPLSDLSEMAKSLNAEALPRTFKTDGAHIKDLAGVISSIDASQLDKRISVDSSHNELKDLSVAINDMLNRIHDSYQSQVRFVSDASHELRTPISVIQGYINLLDRWGKNDEKTMQESIDAIKSETENMKELVEQLLFLARGDNETLHLEKQDFDVCEIVDEVIKETQIIDPNHNFKTDLNSPAYIKADWQLIKQVIRILVDNAIKYTPQGNEIILKVTSQEEFVHIIVQDTGIGIEPECLSQVFERFYRSDESRARKSGGSGLGLSIAKWIIEQHEGHFEILSRVNIGTRITVAIPVSKLQS